MLYTRARMANKVTTCISSLPTKLLLFWVISLLVVPLSAFENCPCDNEPSCVSETCSSRCSNCEFSNGPVKSCTCESGCSTSPGSCPNNYADLGTRRSNCFFGWKRRDCIISCRDRFAVCRACKDPWVLSSDNSCVTRSPTPFPTPEPTPFPTPFPTPGPTAFPTPKPTSFPTPEPTNFPTPEPTRPCGNEGDMCAGVDFIGGECCIPPSECQPFNSEISICRSPPPSPSPTTNSSSSKAPEADDADSKDQNDIGSALIVGGLAGAFGIFALLVIGMYNRKGAQNLAQMKMFLDKALFDEVEESRKSAASSFHGFESFDGENKLHSPQVWQH